MNNLDRQYKELLEYVMRFGNEKSDRTGTGTKSIFSWELRHNMKEGFPLLTTKKMYWKGIVTELLWFLRGETNIKYLVDNGCHIWDGDAYKNWCKQFEVDPNNFNSEEVAKGHNDQCGGHPLLENTSKEYKRGQINAYLEGKADKPFFYLTKEEFINKIKTDDEFAKKWGELGPIYGKQWRSWKVVREDNHYFDQSKLNELEELGDDPDYFFIDQIANLISELKTNPDSRRLMVNAWNVGELDQMVLPPCHYGFQVYTRELTLDERQRIFDNRGYVCDVWPFHGNWHSQYDGFKIPRRAISLKWNQRSVDTFLGLPFNIASYGLLLCILGEIVNMVPEELIGCLGDVHLYNNHIEQAKEQLGYYNDIVEVRNQYPELKEIYEKKIVFVREQNYTEAAKCRDEERAILDKILRTPYPLPTLNINTEFWAPSTDEGCGMGAGTYSPDFDGLVKSMEISDFQIENYQSHPAIKAPLSN